MVETRVVVNEFIDEIASRFGIGDEWYQIDDVTQEEIRIALEERLEDALLCGPSTDDDHISLANGLKQAMTCSNQEFWDRHNLDEVFAKIVDVLFAKANAGEHGCTILFGEFKKYVHDAYFRVDLKTRDPNYENVTKRAFPLVATKLKREGVAVAQNERSITVFWAGYEE